MQQQMGVLLIPLGPDLLNGLDDGASHIKHEALCNIQVCGAAHAVKNLVQNCAGRSGVPGLHRGNELLLVLNGIAVPVLAVLVLGHLVIIHDVLSAEEHLVFHSLHRLVIGLRNPLIGALRLAEACLDIQPEIGVQELLGIADNAGDVLRLAGIVQID